MTKYLLSRRGNGLLQKIWLLERELLPQLFGYKNQNENWYGLENEEEKADKKMNITGGKTR